MRKRGIGNLLTASWMLPPPGIVTGHLQRQKSAPYVSTRAVVRLPSALTRTACN